MIDHDPCDEYCRACGDRLIHQSARKMNESSSPLGQYVHDHFSNTHYWMDIDGVTYAKSTGILRVVEAKPMKGRNDLSQSQRRILPLLARAIELLIAAGEVDADSGVFYLRHSEDFLSSEVQEIGPSADFLKDELAPKPITADLFRRFCQGQPALDTS